MYYKQIYVIFAHKICKFGAKYQVAIPLCIFFWFDKDFTGNGAKNSSVRISSDIGSGKKEPIGN